MDADFLAERITKTKAMIIAYEEALLALSANPLETYKLDTGQSIQTVTRSDIGTLQKTLDVLYNRLCIMQARETGSGVVIVRPAY